MGAEQKYAAGFHAQQAVEKAAKAFLVHHNIRPPRTHDIEQLGLQIKPIHTELGKRLIKLRSLTRFAVIYRYPDAETKAVSFATIKTTVKNSQLFYDLVLESLI